MRTKPGTTSSPPLALIGFFKIPEGNKIGMGITVDLGRNASVLPWCSWGRTRGYSNRYGRQWLSHATKHGGPVQPPKPQSMAGSPPSPQLEWMSIWTTPSSCLRKCLQDENIHRDGSACKCWSICPSQISSIYGNMAQFKCDSVYERVGSMDCNAEFIQSLQELMAMTIYQTPPPSVSG